MPRGLGRDAPDLDKLYARKPWAEFFRSLIQPAVVCIPRRGDSAPLSPPFLAIRHLKGATGRVMF